MKRVQIILEEWQHDWLGQEAKTQSTSASALLRQILTEAIERSQAQGFDDDPIWGIVGMAEAPDDGITSENLDEFLYQPTWYTQSQPLLKVAENGPSDS